jgi:hypothetical protein
VSFFTFYDACQSASKASCWDKQAVDTTLRDRRNLLPTRASVRAAMTSNLIFVKAGSYQQEVALRSSVRRNVCSITPLGADMHAFVQITDMFRKRQTFTKTNIKKYCDMSCNVSRVLEPAVQDPISLRPVGTDLGHNVPKPIAIRIFTKQLEVMLMLCLII